MLCNAYIFEQYKGLGSIDPGRFGAQVISGIGFLGAGTILKEGVTIKGLTTAAGLWSVGCIGLAVGLGFYYGAIVTTILVLIILVVFSKFEERVYGNRKNTMLKIKSTDEPGQIGKIGTELGKFNVQICDISMEVDGEASVIIRVRLNKAREDLGPELMDSLSKLEGISYVQVCE
jgi:putative Mg2+ transporter-C (MgtC) family protein